MTTEATEAAMAAGHAAEAAEKGGMPQLDFSTYPNQIFWLLVTLVVVYLILTKFALPRISSVLAERQGTITNDLAAAEELKLKAQEAEEAYNKALAEARAEAQRIANETRAAIKADLDKAIAKADAEIAAKTAEAQKAIAEIRAHALESVQEVAKDVAREIVALLGGKPDARSITAAVKAHLKGEKRP